MGDTATSEATPSSLPVDGGRVRGSYFPALDGLRGLTVIAVMLYHASVGFTPRTFPWFQGGFLGVPMFFVLSGFLVTWGLIVGHGRAGRIDLRGFWTKRVRRLVPAAWITVMVTLTAFRAAGLEGEAWQALRVDGLWAALPFANFRFVFSGVEYGGADASSPLLHFWSLAIEQQVYLTLPVVAAVVLRATRGSYAALGGFLAAAAAGSTALMVTSHTPGGAVNALYLATPTRVGEILVGGVAAVMFAAWRRSGRTAPAAARLAGWSAAAVSAGIVAAAWATVEMRDEWLYEGGFAAMAVISAVVVVAATTATGPVRLLLGWRPLRMLGQVSYGVYLFHWPIFLLLTPERTGLGPWALLAVRAAVTIAAAAVSWKAMERPINAGLTLPELRARRPVVYRGGAVAAAMAVAVFGLFVYRSPADAPQATAAPAAPAAVTADPGLAQVLDGLDGRYRTAAADPDRARSVLIVGDSLVHQGWEQTHAAFARVGVEAWFAGGDGTGPLYPQNQWRDQVAAAVADADPDVVVIEACCNYADAGLVPGALYRNADGTEVVPGTDAVHDAWAVEIEALIDAASARGATVLLTLNPTMTDTGIYGPVEAFSARLNDLYRRLAADGTADGLVDWWTPTGGGNGWSQSLTGGNGTVEARVIDGVHFTPAGSEILAAVTVAAVTDADAGSDPTGDEHPRQQGPGRGDGLTGRTQPA